jgi:hypothetical protein
LDIDDGPKLTQWKQALTDAAHRRIAAEPTDRRLGARTPPGAFGLEPPEHYCAH